MRKNASNPNRETPAIPPTTPPAIVPAFDLEEPPAAELELFVDVGDEPDPDAVLVSWTSVPVDSGAIEDKFYGKLVTNSLST